MKVTLFTLLILVSSCGKFKVFKRSSQEKQNISKIYATGNLTVAVYYEPGAEPFTDTVVPVPGFPSIRMWDVLESNLKAMFPGKTITVPKDLNQMAALSAQNKATWQENEIYDLGNNQGQPSLADTTVFNVYFIKGRLNGNPNVIGVHLSNTKTIAVFKDVVVASSTGVNASATQRYVEQATLVHEMGHGVGLVNNGVPMTSSHEEQSSGHQRHCSNPDCVMYWKNEGTSDLVGYITIHLLKLNPVMLDSACLNDVTSYK